MDRDEEQFLQAARYVVLNAVEAGICARPEQWRWSSYRATVGLERAPEWLDVAGLLAHFNVFEPGNPLKGYRRFVENSPLAVSDTVMEL